MVGEYIFKIIVIGDPMVGKTSLLQKFATKKFRDSYIRTIGANIIKRSIFLDGNEIDLLIWDLAGQKEFSEMFPSYFDGSNGVIIAYDISRKDTFDNVENWYKQCLKHNIAHVPMILVGNKIDLERNVSKEDAIKKANQIGIEHFETSAKTGECIDEIFEKIGANVYNLQKMVV